jgi:hypothetical protein
MDVSAAGASPNRLDSLVPPSPPVNPLPQVAPQSVGVGQTVDRIAATLQDLSGQQVGQLLTLLDHARGNQDPMLIEGLLKDAVAAAHGQRLPDALKTLEKMVVLSPEHGPQLARTEPGLIHVQRDFRDLMQRLETGAKTEAERIVLAASLAVAMDAQRMLAPNTTAPNTIPPQDLLALAARFLESGQYANYIRAAELGGIVLARYSGRPAGSRGERLRKLWRRAPLLVLLLGWLGVGLVGGVLSVMERLSGAGPISEGTVEIWATGFLMLVLFQFFVTVRNFR